VALLAELDLVLPSPPFDRRALLDRAVPAIVARARSEGGLPFSKYDLDDLRELDPARLGAIARLQGLGPAATPEAILKVGDRVYRARAKTRPSRDGYAFMVPILLGPIARCALRAGSASDAP
jgi:hypothetical protein